MRIFDVDGNNETEIEYKVNRVLMEIGTWCETNKLSLSSDKTCYTVFGHCCSDKIKLFLSGIQIKSSECVKYLGLLTDNQLKWINHIDHVCNKIIRYVGIFYKLRNKLPVEILKQLYFAFVHSHITYAAEIYVRTTRILTN